MGNLHADTKAPVFSDSALYVCELDIARKLPAAGSSLKTSEEYTRWLATHHYENFTIATYLVPRHLRQHFYNIYAYCRWSDDLGDEIGDCDRSLQLLNAWQEELEQCYAGSVRHPVFIALRNTIETFAIPITPFSDLLTAFRQDQTIHRYPTWISVMEYCRYSANPVGRLVLYLGGYSDDERQRLSDFTCTALQLANFWQDVARDLEKDRIYMPLDFIERHGLQESDLFQKKFDARYVALMRNLVEQTRDLFQKGLPLAQSVSRDLRIDIELFSRCGIAVLEAIESIGYNTLQHRPEVTTGTKLKLLGRALGEHALGYARR
jgi:squalene synthase HpnC